MSAARERIRVREPDSDALPEQPPWPKGWEASDVAGIGAAHGGVWGPSSLQQQRQQQQQQQQQQTVTVVQQSTDIDAFEPLPDSPTGGHAAGRGLDQQRSSSEGHELDAAVAQKPFTPQDGSRTANVKELKPSIAGPSPGTAHVHLIGEITGAVGLCAGPLYCTWQLVYDTRLWSIKAGQDKGRTHASSPLLAEDGSVSGVVWECPMDLLLATSTMQQWPSIIFKLFHRSVWLGRDEFVGYSLCSLPNTPGCHHISCPVWVAAEGRRSLGKELMKFFTGLNPQLVDESLITDMEQRFEQGQHLHTVTCSTASMQDSTPYSSSTLCTGGPGVAAAAGSSGRMPLQRPHCSSISAASRCTAAVVGSGICLRLHVLTRGTCAAQLSRLHGDGAESIERCLERLHSSVEKIRRQQAPRRLQEVGSSDEEGDSQAAKESQGVRLVREGRAMRLEAVHRQLFGGGDSDRGRGRDQLQGQQLSPTSSRRGATMAQAAVGATTRRTPTSPGGIAAAVAGGPGRLRALASLSGDSSSSGPGPRSSGAGAASRGRSGAMGSSMQQQQQQQQQQPAWQGPGVEAGGSPSRPASESAGSNAGGSPLRRDATNRSSTSRWAGRFAPAPSAGPSTGASPGLTTDTPLLPEAQERS